MQGGRGGVIGGASRSHRRQYHCALAAACVFGLGVGVSHAASDDLGIQTQLKAEAAQLLQSGDIAGFDRRATELRRSRERTPSGIWKLSLFYKGVENLPENPSAPIWAKTEAATDAYLQAHLDSPAAVAVAAHVLVTRAWAYRGDRLGYQLSSQQQDAFATWLERARVVLDAHREVGKTDPEWYSLRIQIMNGEGEDRAAILALAQEALSGEPTYQSTYNVASTAFLPKWGGSARLLQQYLAALLASAQAEEGQQPFARIAFNIARNDPKPIELLRDVGVQWPQVKESLEEITAAYPDELNRNKERAMACLMGTEQDFNSSSSRTGPRLISVAWFDTAPRWRDCDLRRRAAAPVSFNATMQSIVSASPSPYLPTTVCCAVLLSLAALYASRRLRTAAADGINAGGTSGAAFSGPGMAYSGDPSTKVYRATWLWKAGQIAAGGVLFLIGIAGVWGFGAMADDSVHQTTFGLGLIFCSALLASAGVMVVIDAMVSRLVLQGSVLEIVELWRTQRIRREELASRQSVRRPNAPAQLVLQFKQSGRRPAKIPLVFSMDTQFHAWIEPIPDLDTMAASALEAQIRSDPELGATAEERIARFAQASQFARYVSFVGPALFFWSAFYPRPYVLIIAILAALPWVCVGLMMKYPGVYQLNGKAGSGRPDLTGAFIAGGVLLAMRSYFDAHILDWSALLPWAAAAGIFLAVAMGWVNRSATRRVGNMIVILLVSGAYGFGAATYANSVFDASTPSSYRPSVLHKHVSGGRYRTYELLVGPWGTRKAAENINVSAALYGQLRVGQPVCVALRSGALGIQWYRVSVCNESASH